MAEVTLPDTDEEEADDTIAVVFTPGNDIQTVKAGGGLTSDELLLLTELIAEDPLWLQSPADRAVNAHTRATLEKDELRTAKQEAA